MSESGPAYVEVAATLRNRILEGDLPAGQRLPPEIDLAVQFGVSRSTIREALRHLASQHLIITKQGKTGGSLVAEPTVAQIGEYVASSVGLLAASGTLSFTSLLEARSVVEAPAARLAAERRTLEQLRDLRETLSFDPGGVSPEDRTRDFHLLVLQAAGNPMIEIMARPVFDLLRTHYVRRAASTRFWSDVKHDHSDIYEAIASQDGAGAQRAMRSHIEDLIDIYRDL